VFLLFNQLLSSTFYQRNSSHLLSTFIHSIIILNYITTASLVWFGLWDFITDWESWSQQQGMGWVGGIGGGG
jgi:hypothetical protein